MTLCRRVIALGMAPLDSSQQMRLAHSGIGTQEKPRHSNAPRQTYQLFDLLLDLLGRRMTDIQVLENVLRASKVILCGDWPDHRIEVRPLLLLRHHACRGGAAVLTPGRVPCRALPA
jgi:hypothetical protein